MIHDVELRPRSERLATTEQAFLEGTVHSSAVPQLDLIAMRNQYAFLPRPTEDEDWTEVTFAHLGPKGSTAGESVAESVEAVVQGINRAAAKDVAKVNGLVRRVLGRLWP